MVGTAGVAATILAFSLVLYFILISPVAEPLSILLTTGFRNGSISGLTGAGSLLLMFMLLEIAVFIIAAALVTQRAGPVVSASVGILLAFVFITIIAFCGVLLKYGVIDNLLDMNLDFSVFVVTPSIYIVIFAAMLTISYYILEKASLSVRK